MILVNEREFPQVPNRKKCRSILKNASPILVVSQFAGVFSFSIRGRRLSCLTLWCFLISCSVGPSSVGFATWQMERASRSLLPTKRKEQVYTLIELCKSLLFSSSLLLHFFVSRKHRSAFTAVIGTLSKITTPFIGKWDLLFGTALSVLRSLCLAYALSMASNIVDVYVLRSNSIINVLVWLNYLILFQMITLLKTVKFHLTVWKMSSSNYALHIYQHAWMIEITQQIVSLYGPQLVLITCQGVLAATTSCYYLLTNLIFNEDEVLLLYHAIDVLSFALSTYQIFFLNKTCKDVGDQVDSFYKELFRLMRESKTLCSNKKLCLYVSMRRTVNFTACGFFSLGYPLITSIIAAATTYLVILVQFSIPKS